MNAASPLTPAAGTVPGAIPVLGHALALLRAPLPFLRSLPAHGDLVQLRFGPQRAYMVCTPELTHQVLTNDHTFDKGGPVIDRIRETIGNGVGTCPRSEHRRQRRLVQPAFTAARLADYAPIMTREITAVTERWQPGQTIDVLADMQALTGRILVSTMFAGIAEHRITAIIDSLNAAQDGFLTRVALPTTADKLPLPAQRRSRKARAHLRHLLGGIIDQRRSDPHGEDHGDLLSTLLASPDSSPEAEPDLTTNQIIDQCLNFFFAGTETAATLMTWSLHLIALNPDIEQQLHAEADQVLAGAPATYQDLPRLELARRIIIETLRLYPPGWILTRTTTQDTRLAGRLLSAGTPVVYSPYLIHHHPDVYPNPEEFAPDRWKDNNPSTQPPHGAFVPFGGGARKCIGDNYGIIEATLALASIAARWQLDHAPGTRVRPTARISLSPRGLSMIAIPRFSRASIESVKTSGVTRVVGVTDGLRRVGHRR
ncbi:cytochrome P450 [Streptomyces sp. NPDC002845]